MQADVNDLLDGGLDRLGLGQFGLSPLKQVIPLDPPMNLAASASEMSTFVLLKIGTSLRQHQSMQTGVAPPFRALRRNWASIANR